jgi:hypothetical protein
MRQSRQGCRSWRRAARARSSANEYRLAAPRTLDLLAGQFRLDLEVFAARDARQEKDRRRGYETALATRRRDRALLVRSFGDGSFPGVAVAWHWPRGGQRGIRSKQARRDASKRAVSCVLPGPMHGAAGIDKASVRLYENNLTANLLARVPTSARLWSAGSLSASIKGCRSRPLRPLSGSPRQYWQRR